MTNLASFYLGLCVGEAIVLIVVYLGHRLAERRAEDASSTTSFHG